MQLTVQLTIEGFCVASWKGFVLRENYIQEVAIGRRALNLSVNYAEQN